MCKVSQDKIISIPRQKNNLAAPDVRFVYQRLISDALVEKYENPKLLRIWRAFTIQTIQKGYQNKTKEILALE